MRIRQHRIGRGALLVMAAGFWAMSAAAADDGAGKWQFLVEMDHAKSGEVLTKQARREFIETIILPTLALAEKYAAEGKIVAGGPVAGRIAVRLIVQVDSPEKLDQLLQGLPLWRVAETRITPLTEFSTRKTAVQAVLERLKTEP